MSGGGGSSSPTTTTTQTSNIPEYAAPYVLGDGTPNNLGLLPQAAALTNINNNPYQAYGGQTTAGFSPLQNQAFGNIQQMKPSSQTSQATGFAGLAGLGAQNIAGSYNPGQIGYNGVGASYNPNSVGYQQTGINNYNQGAVNQYMSPYTQDVINAQSNQAIRSYGQSLPQLASATAANGDLGGSREALLQSQANQGLQSQLQGIQASGLQSGFANAQNQFNTQNQLGLQSQMANQGAGLQAQGQGLQSAQFGSNLGLQAQGMNQQAQLQAQGQGLQSQQFGSNLGLQGLQTQLGAANTLGQLGSNQYAQQAGIDTAQLQAGQQQQGLQQQQLNTAYQNFINQQNYPYAQLGYLSDILHGTATTASGSGIYANYQQAPNTLGQVAGLGTAATGLAGLFGSAATGG